MTNYDVRVAEHIRGYPSLYRDVTYEKSRAKVLVHLVLGYGTGEYWHEDGSLANIYPFQKQVSKSLEWDPEYFTAPMFREIPMPEGSTLAPFLMPEENREPVNPGRLCSVMEYSPIMSIPDNAQLDALQACWDAWKIYRDFFVQDKSVLEKAYAEMHPTNVTKSWYKKFVKDDISKHRNQVKTIEKRLRKLGCLVDGRKGSRVK